MKAVVFHGPGDMRVDDVSDPKIEQPTDAILKVTATAICGSDLHLYNGFFPQKEPMVMGHEFMGIVEEVGSKVKNLKPGDRVVVPFPIACGSCFFCGIGLHSQCEKSNPEHYGPEGGQMDQKGGGLFGYTDLYGGYRGGQAQYVRVPYADVSPRKVPDSLDDAKVLFLTDILPTGYSGLRWANVKGGETVVVFGCGPVGLMAQKCAWAMGAKQVIGVDIQPYRLEMARNAAKSHTINAKEGNVVEQIRELTEGRGADVCVDAVGMEADRTLMDKAAAAIRGEGGSIEVLKTAFSAVRRGGSVSILGVYGTNYNNFPLGQIFDKAITIHAGQALVLDYIDELIQWVETGKVRLDDIITHELPLSEAPHGYQIFNNKEDGCVKVVLQP